jgi:hypothetical protein
VVDEVKLGFLKEGNMTGSLSDSCMHSVLAHKLCLLCSLDNLLDQNKKNENRMHLNKRRADIVIRKEVLLFLFSM